MPACGAGHAQLLCCQYLVNAVQRNSKSHSFGITPLTVGKAPASIPCSTLAQGAVSQGLRQKGDAQVSPDNTGSHAMKCGVHAHCQERLSTSFSHCNLHFSAPQLMMHNKFAEQRGLSQE